jgi:hypothetical protein
LNPIRELEMRFKGGELPAGECPKCGALAYLVAQRPSSLTSCEVIHDRIQNLNVQHGADGIPEILEMISNKLAEVEARLERADLEIRQAAREASCLANGIQPD